MNIRKRAVIVALAVVLVVAIAGAAVYALKGGKSKSSNTAKATELKIDAVLEVKTAMTKLVKDFEAQDKSIKVTTNYVAAGGFAAAVKKDKPDLVVGTRPQLVTLAKTVKFQSKPTVFGSDLLTIVVAKGNPHKIKAELSIFGTHTSVTTGTCKTKGRCLSFTTELLKASKIDAHPDRTDTPAALVNAVADNKLDAALVLRSQAMQRAGKTTRLGLAAKGNAGVQYATARVRSGGSVAKFMAFLATPKGTTSLVALGLRAPTLKTG